MAKQESDGLHSLDARRPPSIAAPGERRRIERKLHEVGVLCQPEVSLQYQALTKRSVLRAVESGGAIKDLGRYVTFCDELGGSLSWLQPIDSVATNGRHAVVIGTSFVSVEVFRIRKTYDVLMIRYEAVQGTNGHRGRTESNVLFRGRQGYLPLDLTNKSNQECEILPEFFNKAGERLDVPPTFLKAVRAAVKGANCIGCTHQHFLVAPQPIELRQIEPDTAAAVATDVSVPVGS